jgi:hypothetical protein
MTVDFAEIKKYFEDGLNSIKAIESIAIQESDIDLINSTFKTKFTEDDVSLFCFMGSDNLVNRSFRKWHLKTLKQICDKSVGIRLIKNHSWSEVDGIKGYVYKTEMKTFDSIPPGYQQVNGYAEVNQGIVQEEKLNCVYFYVMIPNYDLETVNALKYRLYDSCSTGGTIDNVSLICPHCSAEYGREISFTEKDKTGNYICPHNIPYSFLNPKYIYDEELDYNFADYAEIKGEYDSVELSLVVSGNLPQAKLI